MSENKSVKLNIVIGILSQVLTIVINYLTKQAIFNYLGADYMGMQVVFGNICDVLIIAFGGVGTTLLVRMYPAISKHDTQKLSALRNYFDRVSRILIIISGVAGAVASLAAIWFVSSSFSSGQIVLYYLIYLVSILIYNRFRMDYFYLMANEKLYLPMMIYGGLDLVALAVQIYALRMAQNYLVFLLCICAKNILECLVIRIIINKKYPDTRDRSAELPAEEKATAKKDMGYLVISRVGDLLMFSTDSMIISKIISVAVSGLYSNYYFIVNGVQNIVSLVFDSLMAKMGNRYVFAKAHEKAFGYLYLCCINLPITAIGVCGLYWLTDQFITLWMGADALIGHYVVVLSAIEIYLRIARRTIGVCRVNEGIFKEMTGITVFRGVFNVILSIILGIFYGLGGIMAATVITDVATVYWYEPYIVLKRYETKFRFELLYQFISLLTVAASLILTGWAVTWIPLAGWVGFIVKGCIVVIVAGVFSGAVGWGLGKLVRKLQMSPSQWLLQHIKK